MKDAQSTVGKKTLLILRLLFTVCLIGTVIFIFQNSSRPGVVSAGSSGRVTEFANRIMARTGLSFRFSEHLIRKLGHFAEYALLGFWLMLTLRVYTRRILSFISWPLFFGLLTAVADEWYQTMIPGRSGQVTDVVIDFCGVTAGLMAALFALLAFSAVRDAFRGRR